MQGNLSQFSHQEVQEQHATGTMPKHAIAREMPSEYLRFKGNFVHKTAVVNWSKISIGSGNIIGPYACIGTEAQHANRISCGNICIGDHNIFREHSTVHLPTQPNCGTIIGNNNFIMVNAHVAHDCYLENDIVICNNAALAGHVHVMQGATLALNSSVHQFQIIGSWAMLGMNSCVNKSAEILPGNSYFGVPAKRVGKNKVALTRRRIKDSYLSSEIDRFRALQKKSTN